MDNRIDTDDKDPNPCRVIGVLDDGVASLNATALAHLRSADVVIGGARTLALLAPELKAGTVCHDLTGRLKDVPAWVRAARADHLQCVVLATGDPLCHGIAPYLAQHLCVQALDILPNLSTLQLACARIGLAWHDAAIVSVHAKDAGEWRRGATPEHGLYGLAQALRTHARLLVLTSPDNSPDRIARLLLAEGLGDDFLMAVAENLLQPEERVLAELPMADAAGMRFAPLNVVLLWRVAPAPRPVRFGLPDTAYVQRQPEKGLITKQEVRAVSLARLQLRADSVVWDIGAGSGSVGLEAARLCPHGHVYAIEKNEADHAIAAQNHAAFGVANYSLHHGKAPEGLDAWPDPDAVFIGGSGGELAGLIGGVMTRLRPGGTLVMNFVTLENLATATAALAALEEGGAGNDFAWDVVQLQAARSKPILHMHRMAAENPVWIVCAQRAGSAA
ncbi:precorrin-6y C5,15-methyltransferase (decarboxylating) subunit CbiE [Pseudoduganella albidiflava]|uniref:Precorrin-6Y-methylase n=1 Tax=Pseudoduganella albidiflava TaxID=321983 RepID=A0A411X123_9BURK|nr:precorrin-6y C5,15-methyltransferase (decarboxylating) subunit CbiE [Pseudoduganella albidiflava]QBI02638.1 precorrin-6y C5,15-methyltransferase (decarboxylating) subunit CbiE [Pseudoduganella albidiflava]GGY41093.1 precorrin-6Y-methylase [Pseudoduganella albidiflava]